MIKSKSLKYSCVWICNVDVQIIDWISDWQKLIFQYEPNKHRNKTRNQTMPHKTTNNTMPHSDYEITKTLKKTLDMYGNHLFRWK